MVILLSRVGTCCFQASAFTCNMNLCDAMLQVALQVMAKACKPLLSRVLQLCKATCYQVSLIWSACSV